MNVKELSKKIFRPLRGLKLVVMLFVALQHIMAVLQPYYMGKLVDNVQSPKEVLLRLSGILLLLVVLDFFLNWLQNFLWFKMDYKSIFLLRSEMFRRVLRNPFSFFQKNPKGDVVNRVMDDSAQYGETTILKTPMLVANISKLLIVFVMIFVAQPIVGGILFVMCLLYFCSYRYINIRLRDYSAKERERYSRLLHKTNTLYEGFLTIKLFGREEYFAKDYHKTAEKLCKGSISLQKWKSLAQSLSGMILNLMPVVVLVSGAFLIVSGHCTLGAVFSIYSYVGLLGEPIQNLTDYNIMLQRGKINEERLDALLDGQPEQEDADSEEKGNEDFAVEDISLRKVGFSYDGEHSVLNGFDMELVPGERIGIVGHTGSGKTTLLRLLTGQLYANRGEMLVNGQNIRGMSLARYLKRVAVVPQDIFLYDDSVMGNILFGRKENSACLDTLKDRLEISGYENHEIGKLSGGERKRVGIARALLGDYDLLILDEPTADVDAAMEQKIIELIREFTADGKMLLVITHRPAILEICTQVVEMKGQA